MIMSGKKQIEDSLAHYGLGKFEVELVQQPTFERTLEVHLHKILTLTKEDMDSALHLGKTLHTQLFQDLLEAPANLEYIDKIERLSKDIDLLQTTALFALGGLMAHADIHNPLVVGVARVLHTTGVKDCDYVNDILERNK